MFEAGDVVGGRLATVLVAGREYETGGSIIHSANQYMVRFLAVCQLEKKISPPDQPFALHSNPDEDILFQANC